jgi:hypothetical protein
MPDLCAVQASHFRTRADGGIAALEQDLAGSDLAQLNLTESNRSLADKLDSLRIHHSKGYPKNDAKIG